MPYQIEVSRFDAGGLQRFLSTVAFEFAAVCKPGSLGAKPGTPRQHCGLRWSNSRACGSNGGVRRLRVGERCAAEPAALVVPGSLGAKPGAPRQLCGLRRLTSRACGSSGGLRRLRAEERCAAVLAALEAPGSLGAKPGAPRQRCGLRRSTSRACGSSGGMRRLRAEERCAAVLAALEAPGSLGAKPGAHRQFCCSGSAVAESGEGDELSGTHGLDGKLRPLGCKPGVQQRRRHLRRRRESVQVVRLGGFASAKLASSTVRSIKEAVYIGDELSGQRRRPLGSKPGVQRRRRQFRRRRVPLGSKPGAQRRQRQQAEPPLTPCMDVPAMLQWVMAAVGAAGVMLGLLLVFQLHTERRQLCAIGPVLPRPMASSMQSLAGPSLLAGEVLSSASSEEAGFLKGGYFAGR